MSGCISLLCFRCGQCSRYMKYVDVKPTRLHCAVCNVTYKLPQNGMIKLYQELKCPLDNFELVMWTTGIKGKVCTSGMCMCMYMSMWNKCKGCLVLFIDNNIT